MAESAKDPTPPPPTPEEEFQDSMRQDLKKEIKMIKESKNKKKHKHRHHRSHSRSPDAQFSSGSEQDVPSYIRKEYEREEGKETKREVEMRGQDSPLRYDPDEEEVQKREVLHPKGSILLLKTHQLDMHSKRKGRFDLNVRLLTEEDHRKVANELFDPGFTKLTIRKDKNETEIIQYLNRSKKKYKYLVCWWEA